VTRWGRNGKLQAAANNPSVNVHKPRCGAVLFCTLLKKDVPPRAAEFGLIEPAQAHIPKMTLRDHQAESLHCRNCETTGQAELSQAGGRNIPTR
jgi:hypothetical protein